MEKSDGYSEKLSREMVDRLFEKQVAADKANRDFSEKTMLDWYRSEWLSRHRNREFSNDASAQVKRWKDDRSSEAAGARIEARQIQSRLDDRCEREYLEVLKQGVLEGAIQIHETLNGFAIDTPEEEVREFVQGHDKFRDRRPAPDLLRKGWFLLGAIVDWEKERVNLLRNSLIDEFQVERPSDIMLVDLVVSNYVRAMYATQTEMESIRYADHYRMEMYEIAMEGLQKYIHECENQLLRVLRALHARRETAAYTYTRETYSRTDVNLQTWGVALLRALADITETKEREIDIDEIKFAMSKHVIGLSTGSIPNAWIGYALERFGFIEKIHVTEGNRYNIDRKRVLTLLNEGLKT